VEGSVSDISVYIYLIFYISLNRITTLVDLAMTDLSPDRLSERTFRSHTL